MHSTMPDTVQDRVAAVLQHNDDHVWHVRQVYERLRAADDATGASTFVGLYAVQKACSRLAKKGAIQRVGHGVYRWTDSSTTQEAPVQRTVQHELIEYLQQTDEAVHYGKVAAELGANPQSVNGALARLTHTGMVDRVAAGVYRWHRNGAATPPAPAPRRLRNIGGTIPKRSIDYVQQLPDGKLLISVEGVMWVASKVA